MIVMMTLECYIFLAEVTLEVEVDEDNIEVREEIEVEAMLGIRISVWNKSEVVLLMIFS